MYTYELNSKCEILQIFLLNTCIVNRKHTWFRELLECCPLTSCFRPTGSYLIWLYLLTKVLCLVNTVGQMALVSYFTGSNYSFYDFGFRMVYNIETGRTWEVTGIFPRVTWCEVRAWGVSKLQAFGIQCVLPANFINEKGFIFLWFWLLIATACLLISLIKWTFKLCFPGRRRRYVLEHLKLLVNDDASLRDRKNRERFVRHYLKPDGIFSLHLAENQAGEIVTNDILHLLWCSFRGTIGESQCASNHRKCPYHAHQGLNLAMKRSLDDSITNERSIRSKSNTSPGHTHLGQSVQITSEMPPPPPPGMFTNPETVEVKHRKL